MPTVQTPKPHVQGGTSALYSQEEARLVQEEGIHLLPALLPLQQSPVGLPDDVGRDDRGGGDGDGIPWSDQDAGGKSPVVLEVLLMVMTVLVILVMHGGVNFGFFV